MAFDDPAADVKAEGCTDKIGPFSYDTFSATVPGTLLGKFFFVYAENLAGEGPLSAPAVPQP
jgi:hypothetical protein